MTVIVWPGVAVYVTVDVGPGTTKVVAEGQTVVYICTVVVVKRALVPGASAADGAWDLRLVAAVAMGVWIVKGPLVMVRVWPGLAVYAAVDIGPGTTNVVAEGQMVV